MKGFFLSREDVVKLLLVTLIVVNTLPLGAALFWTLFLCLFFFLRRKNIVFYQDSFSLNADLCFAPINGKVVSVSKSRSENGSETVLIKIVLGRFGPVGLYMPFEGVVENLESFDSKAGVVKWANFTKRPNRYNLALLNKTGQKTLFTFIKRPLGFAPRLYVEPGDKGKALACFGYFPLGGSLTVKLPASAKALVSPGDKLKAGNTAIAGF